LNKFCDSSYTWALDGTHELAARVGGQCIDQSSATASLLAPSRDSHNREDGWEIHRTSTARACLLGAFNGVGEAEGTTMHSLSRAPADSFGKVIKATCGKEVISELPD
jgi:hypothetical protein